MRKIIDAKKDKGLSARQAILLEEILKHVKTH
jgi:hypothetical protein